MPIASPRLRRLDKALAYLALDYPDVMSLSELDGFFTGILLSPNPIMSLEWIPFIWTRDGNGSVFESVEEAEWHMALVNEHYDAIRRALEKGQYKPFFEKGTQRDEILWEPWIDGFRAALALRTEAWEQVLQGEDKEAAQMLACMIALSEISEDASDLERADIDELTEAAPDMIPEIVEALYIWRNSNYPDDEPPAENLPPPTKLGRNDPCPCGSGKKYKKCCGTA